MKKLAALIAGAALLMSAIPVLANGKGPVEKASGEAWFETIYGTVHLTFNAHETNPAKGQVYWERSAPYANWWSGPVTAATVIDEDDATFTVSVDSGAPVVVGCNITFEVHDGGEPSIDVDGANITAVTHTGPGNTCAAVGQIQNLGYADDGNLQVHTY